MKKYILIIRIFVLPALFISSCCPATKYYDIKEKDKLSFNLNDTFIYKSNLNNYDTLFIEEITDEFYYEYTSEALFCGTEFYFEKMFYYLNNPHNEFDEYKRPYFRLVYDEQGTDFNAIYGGMTYDRCKEGGKYTLGTYYVNDKVYENVWVVFCGSCNTDSLICKIFSNKENGFISYQYSSEEQFNLYKYIPNN